jgi:hypothetical protein
MTELQQQKETKHHSSHFFFLSFCTGQAQDKMPLTVNKEDHSKSSRRQAQPFLQIIKLFFNNTQHHKALQKWLKKRFWSACEALPRIMQTN